MELIRDGARIQTQVEGLRVDVVIHCVTLLYVLVEKNKQN